ncbi:MAG: hypothetical protein AB7U63_00735 [Porticoccaceae bacterium]
MAKTVQTGTGDHILVTIKDYFCLMISVKPGGTMGGYGSGRRWHAGAKNTTENFRSIDIRRLYRDGLLDSGTSFCWSWYRGEEKVASMWIRVKADRLVFDYLVQRRGEETWNPKNYEVCLDWTECHLGGQRPWFRCPALGCGRRVAILYSGDIYSCRHCHLLVYESQREKSHDRLARKANRIRAKLDWPRGILNDVPIWSKPKGMHWKTFQRLIAEHDLLVKASLKGIADELRLTESRLMTIFEATHK